MPAYEFVYIDEVFLRSLEDTALNGDTVLIIGSRYAGKRDILNEIEERLKRESAQTNLICKLFFNDRNAMTDADLCRTLNRALPGQMRFKPDDLPTSPDELFRRLDDSFILLVSDIDSIPQSVAERFLRALEFRIQAQKTVAVISGETDIREMLGGIRSDFPIQKKYVVLGYGKSEFKHKLLRLAKQIGLNLTDPDQAVDFLYEQTGGNFHVAELILRQIMREANENEASRTECPAYSTCLTELQQSLKAMSEDLSWREPVALNAIYQIFQSPSCCENLDKLVHAGHFSIDSVQAREAPIVLELAGAAKRVPKSSNGHSGLSTDAMKVDFTFSSPLMETFLKGYFDEVRLGDLYVSSGDWENAIARYKASPPEKRIRPRNAGDRSRAEFVVRSLCTRLHTMATEPVNPVEKVDNLFEDGCRFILGFPEVSFFCWRRDRKRVGRWQWQLVKPDLRVNEEQYETIFSNLPAGDQLARDFTIRPYVSNTIGIAVKGQHNAEREAIILSDFTGGTPISPARRSLMEDLIGHYVRARDHALRIDKNSRRIVALQHYQKINRFIGERLREQRMDVNEVLDYMAAQILELGYSSVALGYHSRLDEKCICGVYMSRGANRAERQWPSPFLEQKNMEAIQTGKDLVIEAEDGKEKYWIFPLRGVNTEKATHTLMVQQVDAGELDEKRKVHAGEMDQERKNDLKNFGEQLVEALQQSERTILLQESLNNMTEPVALVDTDFRVRFVNFAASKVFDVDAEKTGVWQMAQEARLAADTFTDLKKDKIMAWLNESLRSGQLLQTSLLPFSPPGGEELGLGKDSLFNGRIEVHSISNSRKRVIGSYLHAQDFAELRCMFAFINLLFAAQSPEVIISLLLNLDRKPNHWRRYYRIDPSSPHLLIGAGAMGEPTPELDAFWEGKRVLDKRESEKECDGSEWLCFQENVPVLFEAYATQERKTKYGVTVTPVPKPRWKGLLGKAPGELWLDVPLISPQPVGKLSIFCTEDIRPQELEFWSGLGATAGTAIANLQREAEGKKNAALAAERVFLSAIAHSIHTRLAYLAGVRSRYSIYEEQNPSDKLKAINSQFGSFLANLQDLIDRLKKQLGQLTISPQRFNLRSTLERFIDSHQLKDQCRIMGNGEEIEIFGDPKLFEEAISELMSNSRDALPLGKELHATIELEPFFSHQKQWVRFVYADNGAGVSLDMKRRIFDLFFTHRTNGTMGTGVGLYYVQRIILAHGGTIEEVGVPGQGARFEMELPIDGLGGRN